jgi:hypothetical protein
MEEERARQAQHQRVAGQGASSSPLETVPEGQSHAMDTVPDHSAGVDDDEERMLAEALALSTQEGDVEMGESGMSNLNFA